MVVTLFIALFTSRIVLKALGFDDFGLNRFDCKFPNSLQTTNNEVICRRRLPIPYLTNKISFKNLVSSNISFARDLQMLVCTVFGKQMQYNGELI